MGGVQDSVIFPVLGVFLSNALYFSPAPAVLTAWRTGRLGSLNVLPQALMLISTCAWVSYALVVPNIYILVSNLPGAIVAVFFATTTLPLIPRNDASSRCQVQLTLVVGAAAQYCLWSVLVFSKASHDTTKNILGLYGSGICVLLFASPLSTMSEVITTNNAASIYAPLTATQCANCFMWTIYGLAIGDWWVYGPNGTGLALGLVQLALKWIYPSDESTARDREVDRLKDVSSDGSDSDRGYPIRA